MKHFTYRLMAVLLALFTIVAGLPLSAFAAETDTPAVSEQKESGTDAITHGDAPEYLEMSDGYISAYVSKKNGGFHVGTAEGDLLTKTDNDKYLMYNDDDFDTSFTTFRVTKNGKVTDYIFGRDYSYMGVATSAVTVSRTADNAIEALWTVDGITFRQTIALMGVDTYQHGMVYVAYTALNTDGTPVDGIEARVLMDTALGTQDYGHYMLGQSNGSYVSIDAEKTISGSDYFNYFFTYDNKTNPNVTAYMLNGTVSGQQVVPEKVTFAHWMDLASTKFDYTPSTDAPLDFTDPYSSIDKLTADSAFAMYYDMGGAETGGGNTISFYYGVYSNYKAGASDVAVNFTSSGSMFLDEAETAYTDINGNLPGNYSSTIKLTNTVDKTFGDIAVAVFPEEQIRLHNGSSFVTSTREDPYYMTVSDLKPGETRDVRFDFELSPTLVTSYRRIRLVVYSASNAAGFTDENRIVEKELFVLCPGATGADVSFTGMTPESVFMKGKRFAYITGTNLNLIRDTSEYRLVLRPTDGSEDVVMDMDKVVVNPERNTVTLILDMELRPTTYSIIVDWNDASKEDMRGDQLELVVTDIPSPGDPGYVSSGVYGIITVERNRTTLHYELVNYDSEEAYRNTQTAKEDILLVMRGDFNVLSSEERPNFKAEAVTLMPGEVITINDCIEVKEGRVTLTKVYDENNKQESINVDIEGKLYTSVANTKVWDGVMALTSINDGELYTLPVYDEQGVKEYRDGEEDGKGITLLWPGAAGTSQTIMGMLLGFRYGDFAAMQQGDSVEYVISFGAALDPSILVPPGMVGNKVQYSNLEKKQREMGLGYYTADQLRATDTQYRQDQANWRDKQQGTLNLYMDDILFGAGGFIGFNVEISVGIPAYTEPLPYIEGTLAMKVINDYWEFGVDGQADMMVFEVEATLKFKSYKGIPVPDEIYFFIGGTNPGVPVDPFGVFWVRGAGAGISDIYSTFFGGSLVPPLTLTLSGEFALFSLLEARADLSISARGFSGALSNLGIAGITVIDRVGGSLYWYPDFSLSFAVRVDILDCIVGEGGIVLNETEDGIRFCGYAMAAVKIPDSIWLIGGKKIGSASIGIDNDKVWGSVKVIGIGVGLKYHWGGKVNVAVGKTYDVPTPFGLYRRAPVALYTDEATGETLYLSIENDILLLSDPSAGLEYTEITTSEDGCTHTFTLSETINEDALLTLSYRAENRFMAQDTKNSMKIRVGEGEEASDYELTWYDDRLDADDPLNVGTNAMFRYDEDTQTATVSVSITNPAYYGKTISVSSDTSSKLEIFGIARLSTLNAVSLNEDMTQATIGGTALDRLSKVTLYAVDEDGAFYFLGETTDSEGFEETQITAPVSIPLHLPTGEYALRAVGVVVNDQGEEIESPMVNGSFSYVNPAQPAAPSGATVSLNGNYTLMVDVTAPDADRDGYLTSIYEMTADGLVATVFTDTETKLEGDAITSLTTQLLRGGRYEVPNEDGGTSTLGLEAGKTYVVSVQSYKEMEDGSRLLSEPTLTEGIMMVSPIIVEPEFSIDGAVEVEFGDTELLIDTVKQNDVTVNIVAEGFGRGVYRINDGENTAWNGGAISLTDLEDGFYTLTVEGYSETNDAFSAKYQFSVDTLAPSILVSSHQGGGFFEGTSVTLAGSTEPNSIVEVYVEGELTVIGKTDRAGQFSINVPVDESVAYQSVTILATDAAGNVSMPFGFDLTNSVLGDPDVEAAILYNGREVRYLTATDDPKQLTFAFKLGTRYVTINKGTTADSKVVWSADIVASTATVTYDGKLYGDSRAAGIVTATLEGLHATVELMPVDLAVVDMELVIPDGGFVYNGEAIEPAVNIDLDESFEEGVDYTVTYLDNTHAGTASVIIAATDDGKCIGVRILNFTIQARSFDDLTITVAEDGTETPAVSVKYGNTDLVKDTDYTVTYTLHSNKTQVIVTVEGIGNFEGIYSVFRNVGEDPGNDPEEDTGNDPEEDTGNDPGEDTGNDPGEDPGNDPGEDPGNVDTGEVTTDDNSPGESGCKSGCNSSGGCSSTVGGVFVLLLLACAIMLRKKDTQSETSL